MRKAMNKTQAFGSNGGDRALLEALEKRSMLSSHTGVYNLQDLMGYNQRGAAWQYDASYTATVDVSSTDGSGTAGIAVRRRLGSYDKHAAFVVDSSSADTSTTSTTTAWYSDRQGTHLAGMVATTPQGSFTLDLHGSLVAPSALVVGGKAFSASGKFDGSFRTTGQGQSLSGSLSGKVLARSQLARFESVDVPAGTFNAVLGVESATVNGTLTVKYQGRTYHVGYSSTVSQEFWAVPGMGVVKDMATVSVVLSEGGDTVRAQVVTDCELADPSASAAEASAPATYNGIFNTKRAVVAASQPKKDLLD